MGGSSSWFIKLVTIFLACGTLLTNAKRNLFIEVLDVSCNSTSSGIMKQLGCFTRDNKLSMFVSLDRIVHNIDVRNTLYLTPKNLPRMTILDLHINACDFFRVTHRQKLFKIFVEQIKSHVNFDLVCTLKPDLNYTLTDFMVNLGNFETNVPPSKYESSYFIFDRGVKQGYLKLKGRIFYK